MVEPSQLVAARTQIIKFVSDAYTADPNVIKKVIAAHGGDFRLNVPDATTHPEENRVFWGALAECALQAILCGPVGVCREVGVHTTALVKENMSLAQVFGVAKVPPPADGNKHHFSSSGWKALCGHIAEALAASGLLPDSYPTLVRFGAPWPLNERQ